MSKGGLLPAVDQAMEEVKCTDKCSFKPWVGQTIH